MYNKHCCLHRFQKLLCRANLSLNKLHLSCKRHEKLYIAVRSAHSSSGDGKTTLVDRVRNIGIMAHVDAGKTTTTERMLYYSGFTRSLGNVDDGNTVTDYMEQERERGITITSAAVTFQWNKHQINLIDTPGHIDFTMEVERALCALDGAVAILDASAGVQAQTLTVWQQANRYNIPRIAYLNKMDKPKANVESSLASIAKKLHVRPLLVHHPIVSNGTFTGLIDLVSLRFTTWKRSGHDDGKTFFVEPITEESNDKIRHLANEKRAKLVEDVADLDDGMAEVVIARGNCDVDVRDLKAALRRLTLQRKGLVTFCGSSFKNVGVQLLMDGIVDYLPSPDEKLCDNLEFYSSEDLCALVFKILYNKQFGGLLVFLRIYNGTVTSGQKVYNVNQDGSDYVGKLYTAHADDFKAITVATKGSIVVATGLTATVTGDTVVADAKTATAALTQFHKKTRMTTKKPLLGGLNVPEPVFFCSIEPASLSHQKKLEHALACMKREDPSMRVKIDKDVGQTVLSGMGELHLDIILDRIKKDYKADAHIGDLQVAYKESVQSVVEDSVTLDLVISDVRSVVTAKLRVEPSKSNSFQLVRTGETHEHLAHLRPKHLKAAEEGVQMGLLGGPILGYPITNVDVGLMWLEIQPRSSLTVITAAVAQCLANCLKEAQPCLLEPHMQLEIVAPTEYVHRILSDLSQRRAEIGEVALQDDTKVISAVVPLAELVGYSTILRRTCSGFATFTMEFKDYRIMSSFHRDQVVRRLTGMI